MRAVSVILSLLLSLSLMAQPPRFISFGAADGLPSNTVYDIAQDADGSLWLGTRGGLCRFDGVSFRTWKTYGRVSALTLDRENRLWVGTPHGLSVDDSTLDGDIRTLLTDSDGFVWAMVGDSLILKLTFDGGIRELARTPYHKVHNEGDYPYFQLYEDIDGRIWSGGRIVHCQYIEDKEHPQAQFRFHENCALGSYARKDSILYAYSDFTSSLYIVEGTEPAFQGRLPVSHAKLLLDRKGRLWAAGTYGLCLVNTQRPEDSPVYKLPSNELYCIFEDREGNLWVGGDHGISVLCPAFQQVKTISTGQVSALLEDSRGKLWIGTREERISCLYEDRSGAVYVGYWNNTGFDIWRGNVKTHGKISGPVPLPQHVVAEGDRITSNWISDFLEGGDGRFWVVSWEGVGLNEWDRKTGKTLPAEWLSPFKYPTPDKDSSIYLSSRLGSRLIEDAAGNLVYGTTEAGLNIIDKDTRLVTKYFRGNSSIPDDYVTDLCLSRDGTLWVATRGGLWSPSGAHYLDGILVQSVRADQQGRLWAGTEEGLYFVDTDGSVGVAKKGLGFPSDVYGEKTACTLSDGRLAFGGPEGAAVFHPDSLLAIQASDNLLLAPLVQHRHRLNGGPWEEGRFPGFPDTMLPGRYTLEEQSSDIFGRWERGTSAIRNLRVPPPLWLRWPFLLLYLLLIAATVWTYIRLRERKLLVAELDKRNRFFSIVSHDLRSPIDGNRMLARELLEQADNLTPEQLKEGIRALSESADNASALLENLLLWSLNQKGMLEPVMREENLAALAQEAVGRLQGGDIIQMDIPEGLTVLTDRNMLLTCLRNLLDNAVKATPTGGKVVLNARGRRIVLTDEGPGLQGDARQWGHGLGLVITRELLDKMGADMHMQNRPEGGLEITIDL